MIVPHPYFLLSLLYLTYPSFTGASIENADISAGRRKVEDNIPVIEIRGEGKPMSSAQIRHIEEMNNGGPLDIKIDKTWIPAKCPTSAKRKDFITFHYKVFTEDGKKVYQTYAEGPVTIQLGVGMIIPGLDKGLKGMCDEELRKVQVPYRLSRKAKSRVWKNIPNDEHWLTFNIEMVKVEPYSHEKQFAFLDMNNDTQITESEIIEWLEKMRRSYGKTWKNEDIDDVLAAKYYIRYFDVNGDGVLSLSEFVQIMERDEGLMKEKSNEAKKAKGRKRDPGVAWILDFNNDGVVSYQESKDKSKESSETKNPGVQTTITSNSSPVSSSVSQSSGSSSTLAPESVGSSKASTNSESSSNRPTATVSLSGNNDGTSSVESSKNEQKANVSKSEEVATSEKSTDVNQQQQQQQQGSNESQDSNSDEVVVKVEEKTELETDGSSKQNENNEGQQGQVGTPESIDSTSTDDMVVPRAPTLGAGSFFIGLFIGFLAIGLVFAGFQYWQRKRSTAATGYSAVPCGATTMKSNLDITSDSETDP